MNKLPENLRIQALNMLVEGSSMRSISRVLGITLNSVTKLLVDAGEACVAHHDATVREVTARHVQCDEIWSFCYAKAKKAPHAQGIIDRAGDVWTWTGIDSDTKLIISWLATPGRDSAFALEFMDDLRARLANRVQLSTDGHRAYLEAVEGAFGGDVDYAQLIKLYGPSEEEQSGGQRRYSPAHCVGIRKVDVVGRPNMDELSTSYVERHNLTMRMAMRRYTRLTNAFSKKLENHMHELALYFTWYNWIRPHKSLLGKTPAQKAGLADRAYDIRWIVQMMDARVPKQKRGPYKPRVTVA